jgi:hypothetical protein
MKTQSRKVRRLAQATRHSLSFNIPGPTGINAFPFLTHERIAGVQVGYDVDEDDLKDKNFSESCEQFVEAFCPKPDVHQLVTDSRRWISRLRIKLNEFCIQLVPEQEFGGGGFMGRGVTGRRKRGLLILEFLPWRSGSLCLPSDENCKSIIPHELMHIKDTVEGRSPALYPLGEPGDGAWIDFLRHLWIDGHLQQLGYPHITKESRVAELRDALAQTDSTISDQEFSDFIENWWGKSMTLHQAIELGLGLGFKLNENCALQRWFRHVSASR